MDMTDAQPQTEVTTSLPELEDVEEAMRDVVDPELGINVVDLGLVYDMTVTDEAVAKLDMTLRWRPARCRTSSGPGARRTGLERAVAPTWRSTGCGCRRGAEKITDDGREQLRALGFTV